MTEAVFQNTHWVILKILTNWQAGSHLDLKHTIQLHVRKKDGVTSFALLWGLNTVFGKQAHTDVSRNTKWKNPKRKCTTRIQTDKDKIKHIQRSFVLYSLCAVLQRYKPVTKVERDTQLINCKVPHSRNIIWSPTEPRTLTPNASRS